MKLCILSPMLGAGPGAGLGTLSPGLTIPSQKTVKIKHFIVVAQLSFIPHNRSMVFLSSITSWNCAFGENVSFLLYLFVFFLTVKLQYCFEFGLVLFGDQVLTFDLEETYFDSFLLNLFLGEKRRKNLGMKNAFCAIVVTTQSKGMFTSSDHISRVSSFRRSAEHKKFGRI